MLSTGEVLAAGKYRIEGELGQGGMSVVLAARDLVLDRAVAIKILQGERSANRQERLLREARAVARLESDHIVRILDTGETDQGQMFIVMERLEGRDLDRHLRRYGKLPLDEAAHFVLQACEALAHAHQAGIVHRDIKPSNMFLVRRADGRRVIKLLDFGIARAEGGQSLTHAGMLGTPQYMSPEQVRNPKEVDPRSDIWSLGVTFFQLLTTKLPFGGTSLNEIVTNILEAQAPSLASHDVDVPQAVEVVLSKCLARKREDRFADVLALAEALLPFTPPEGQAVAAGIRAVMRDTPPTANAPSTTTAAAATTGAWDPTTKPLSTAAATTTVEGAPGSFMTAGGATAPLPMTTLPLTHDEPLPPPISDTMLAAESMNASAKARSIPAPTNEIEAVAATLRASDPEVRPARGRGALFAIALAVVAGIVIGGAAIARWRHGVEAPPAAPPAAASIAAPASSTAAPAPPSAASPPASVASAVVAAPPLAAASSSASTHGGRGAKGSAAGSKSAAPAKSSRPPSPASTEVLPDELNGRH